MTTRSRAKRGANASSLGLLLRVGGRPHERLGAVRDVNRNAGGAKYRAAFTKFFFNSGSPHLAQEKKYCDSQVFRTLILRCVCMQLVVNVNLRCA